jgi:hypothetical protein
VFVNNISWLAATGITKGCAPREFCPNDPVTRGQIAAFIVRAGLTKSVSRTSVVAMEPPPKQLSGRFLPEHGMPAPIALAIPDQSGNVTE